MRHTVKVYTFWLITAILLGIEVFLTIESSTTGSEIAKLEKETQILLEKNRELSESQVKSTSLTRLSEKAKDLGFIKLENIVYLGSKSPFAKLP